MITHLQAIVFDFDGVIANSEPLHFRAFQDVLSEEGVDLSERAYYDRYLGFDDRGVFATVGFERGRSWSGVSHSRYIPRRIPSRASSGIGGWR